MIKVFILGIFTVLIFGFLSLISVYGKPYLLPCSYFPNIEEWKKWENDNITSLEKLSKYAKYDYDIQTCPGKFGLSIFYQTKNDKKNIYNIEGVFLYFRGIPYKLINI